MITTLSRLLCVVLLFACGCGDGGVVPFEPEAYNEWLKFEPEGAVCANGSQYKFFANFSESSDNVLIFLEGGGACWDSESCLRANGIRGAANVECVRNPDIDECLRDDYATAFISFDVPAEFEAAAAELGVVDGNVPVSLIYPLLSPEPEVSPMADWNKVFIPYCTGDVYTGNFVATYSDSELGEVEFRHVGHQNMLKVIDELDRMFVEVPKLTVSGCSAGGAGAISNYYFIRNGMRGVERGYLLDDSGPIFPSDGNSAAIHEEIRDVWGIDSVLAELPTDQGISLDEDFGNMSELLAAEFPDDRLAITFFRLDYNFSLYSYERFWTLDGNDIVPFDGEGVGLEQNEAADRAAVYSLWWEDTAALVEQYDAVDNLAYYLPFYRTTNDSHCVTIPAAEEFGDGAIEDYFFQLIVDRSVVWTGTEIQSEDMNLRDYVEHLLDDEQPLMSFFEDDPEGRYVSCTPPPNYDAEMCEDAVNPSG